MNLKHFLWLILAIGGYVIGLLSIVYMIGFIADVGVPKSITAGAPGSLVIDILIDLLLVLTFGLHHSVTARTRFKKWWIRFIPAPIERSTYLYMTGAMIMLLVMLWRPLPMVVWSFETVWINAALNTAYLGTWCMMAIATFQFGHFDFFGLAQAWRTWRAQPTPPSSMSARYLYAIVRHPISLGWMLTPWLTPTLTLGHVVFAVGTLLYVLLATPYEETDLVQELGQGYTDYQKHVPAFIPTIKPTRGTNQ